MNEMRNRQDCATLRDSYIARSALLVLRCFLPIRTRKSARIRTWADRRHSNIVTASSRTRKTSTLLLLNPALGLAIRNPPAYHSSYRGESVFAHTDFPSETRVNYVSTRRFESKHH